MMTMTHIPIEQLLRFRHGESSREEIAATDAHLTACAECAGVAREMFEVETLRTFREQAEPEQTSRRWIAWTAGALAAAAMIVIVFIPWPRRETPPPAHPPVVTQAAPWSEIVKRALAHGAIDAPPLYRATQMSPDKLRGTTPPDAKTVTLLAPSGTVIDTTRPRFEWTEASDARYEVTVVDGLTVVALSPRLLTNAWTSDRDLARGRVYSWQVRVHRGASADVDPHPPQPPTLFAIAEADASAALAAARRANPYDHLAIGVLAARAGLREVAIAELQLAAAARPDDAAIRSLLQSVKVWRAQA